MTTTPGAASELQADVLLNAAMEAYYAKCGECADAAGLWDALLVQKSAVPRSAHGTD